VWERNAIIYGVDVARYRDGNGDGWGDFVGLIQQLDYIASLHVDCLWILPCFPSPRHDNGYDVEDYFRIDPRLGTLEDFVELVKRAGERGIRIMLDLVVNHTSSAHPWFKAARHDPESRYRRYYVWTEQPPPTPPHMGPIFPGEEAGVWTYDKLAKAHYHHRFYHTEPSLNGANPEVREEIRRILDFWLSFGVAGFRLDAAPHLVEPKGVPGADPEDPHGMLRALFDHVQSRRPDGVMLAEADVTPEELRAFVGKGNQFNLMLNFLLNNYLWLAFATESAEPIERVLNLLPSWNGRGQWANFLRNLDETDLDQLSDAERSQVMQAFAPDEHMQIYGRGMRRRLAPMLSGDSRRLKLAFALLYAIPGAPVIVYGDEVGLGDNLTWRGRDAVRVTMQWDASVNGGFSAASANQLVTTPLAEGDYAYDCVNVNAQLTDTTSLLRFLQRLGELRRTYPQIAEAPARRLTVDEPSLWVRKVELPDAKLVLLHQLGNRAVDISLSVDPGATEAEDLLSGERRLLAGDRLRATIAPYACHWWRIET
jgi:maltose alpha-D-glucosyltransferase / alpha-amylase